MAIAACARSRAALRAAWDDGRVCAPVQRYPARALLGGPVLVVAAPVGRGDTEGPSSVVRGTSVPSYSHVISAVAGGLWILENAAPHPSTSHAKVKQIPSGSAAA